MKRKQISPTISSLGARPLLHVRGREGRVREREGRVRGREGRVRGREGRVRGRGEKSGYCK